MRRKDRALSETDAREILNNGKFGVLSVMGDDGYPYGVPLHYVVIEEKVYFHSTADGGHKEDSLNQNAKVSFTVIETEDAIKARSAILFGTMELVPDRREMVLEQFVEKFVPDFAWEQAKSGIPFAKNAIHAYRLNIDHITGKWVDKPDGK